jgi:transposase
MSERRLVGIDLGITSEHTACVLRGDGSPVCRRACRPTLDSLAELEQAALADAPEQTRLEVVFEPTGPAWRAVAVYFVRRGHVVYRVSSAMASDLRRVLSRHAKSNRIDALTLATLPLLPQLDRKGLIPLELGDREQAALYRRVRACHRLTRLAAEHKTRLKDLVRQLLPDTPLHGALSQADLAVLERTGADPHQLVRLGKARLTRLIADASHHQLGELRAQRWLDAAHSALELFAEHPAVPFEDLAEEIRTEVRLLHATEAELSTHAGARDQAYARIDPQALARSLPGIGEVGAPSLVAALGRAERFPSGRHVRSFSGLAPRSSETGETDRKGQPISKAGPNWLRTTLVLAADHARRQDPQLARVYYVQMTERGGCHTKALCVVAAKLAERALTVFRRDVPYELRDTDGHPVSAEEAKAIIAERWTVPEEVRRRRRSRKKGTKGGKAPQQVVARHANASARSAATRRPSPPPIVAPELTPIKEVLASVTQRTGIRARQSQGH